MTTTIYTDAPPEYDGFGTATTAEAVGTINGKVLRRVSVRDEHLEWQVSRYQSGLREAIGESWYRRFIESGMIVPTEVTR